MSAEFANGCCVGGFVLSNEAAGKRVPVLERLRQALDQQQMQLPIANREEHCVDGYEQLCHLSVHNQVRFLGRDPNVGD